MTSMEKTYKVGGMTCGGCTASVTRALERAFPGASVAVSLDEGTATVRGEHDETAAREAIEEAGFDVAA
jgi:copper chaperone